MQSECRYFLTKSYRKIRPLQWIGCSRLSTIICLLDFLARYDLWSVDINAAAFLHRLKQDFSILINLLWRVFILNAYWDYWRVVPFSFGYLCECVPFVIFFSLLSDELKPFDVLSVLNCNNQNSFTIVNEF